MASLALALALPAATPDVPLIKQSVAAPDALSQRTASIRADHDTTPATGETSDDNAFSKALGASRDESGAPEKSLKSNS